jgi:hypothetical protein
MSTFQQFNYALLEALYREWFQTKDKADTHPAVLLKVFDSVSKNVNPKITRQQMNRIFEWLSMEAQSHHLKYETTLHSSDFDETLQTVKSKLEKMITQ